MKIFLILTFVIVSLSQNGHTSVLDKAKINFFDCSTGAHDAYSIKPGYGLVTVTGQEYDVSSFIFVEGMPMIAQLSLLNNICGGKENLENLKITYDKSQVIGEILKIEQVPNL